MNIDRLTPKLLLKTIFDLAATRRPSSEILTLRLLHDVGTDVGKRIKFETLYRVDLRTTWILASGWVAWRFSEETE